MRRYLTINETESHYYDQEMKEQRKQWISREEGASK